MLYDFLNNITLEQEDLFSEQISVDENDNEDDVFENEEENRDAPSEDEETVDDIEETEHNDSFGILDDPNIPRIEITEPAIDQPLDNQNDQSQSLDVLAAVASAAAVNVTINDSHTQSQQGTSNGSTNYPALTYEQVVASTSNAPEEPVEDLGDLSADTECSSDAASDPGKSEKELMSDFRKLMRKTTKLDEKSRKRHKQRIKNVKTELNSVKEDQKKDSEQLKTMGVTVADLVKRIETLEKDKIAREKKELNDAWEFGKAGPPKPPTNAPKATSAAPTAPNSGESAAPEMIDLTQLYEQKGKKFTFRKLTPTDLQRYADKRAQDICDMQVKFLNVDKNDTKDEDIEDCLKLVFVETGVVIDKKWVTNYNRINPSKNYKGDKNNTTPIILTFENSTIASEILDKADVLRSTRIKRSLTPLVREINRTLQDMCDQENQGAEDGWKYYLEDFKGRKTLKRRKGNQRPQTMVTEELLKEYIKF